MSSCRDDTNETAVATSTVWAGLTQVVDEITATATALVVGLMLLHSDGASASDAVIDRVGSVTVEQAALTDEVSGALTAHGLVIEARTIGDAVIERLAVLHDDTATADDAVIDGAGALVTESATATDDVLASRTVRTATDETAQATDTALQATSEDVTDAATADDAILDRLAASDTLDDTAALSDDAHGATVSRGPVAATEAAMATDAVTDHLDAADTVSETVVIEDAVRGSGGDATGQTWTANADSWAMSRYAPCAFSGLTVIDGTAYGLAADGLYALDGTNETIDGALVTGTLDLSGGPLVHPLGAYLEYALAEGSASMTVTTTQGGAPASYDYALPAEPADALVSGRIDFGKGLRGRHFAFALRLTGRSAEINDLIVAVATTKRRT